MNNLANKFSSVREAINYTGFAHIPKIGSYLPDLSQREAEFNNYWDDLVRDENYKSYTNRHRRILRYWYKHPGQMYINKNNIFTPKVNYKVNYKRGANNLTYAQNAFIEDQLTQRILHLDIEILSSFLTNGQLYSIDMDQFRVSSSNGEINPTTSGRHQDGEDWICMHFVGASNIKPVVSEILPANEEEAPLFCQPMTGFLETLIVNDRLLFHAAGPVEQEDPSRPAHRNLLLVSLSAIAAIPCVE